MTGAETSTSSRHAAARRFDSRIIQPTTSCRAGRVTGSRSTSGRLALASSRSGRCQREGGEPGSGDAAGWHLRQRIDRPAGTSTTPESTPSHLRSGACRSPAAKRCRSCKTWPAMGTSRRVGRDLFRILTAEQSAGPHSDTLPFTRPEAAIEFLSFATGRGHARADDLIGTPGMASTCHPMGGRCCSRRWIPSPRI